ncbi:hypothetical protein BKA65DRAFT_484323 [Rhexocercosporidium sp. MPI-PUGE-AT-0058]|nr:hypothetical protein BKA65DRAFT_484323 [Rhexocercosporidium sp. MPI-PUGE-AT-0058]
MLDSQLESEYELTRKSSSISGDTGTSIGTSFKKPPKHSIDYRRQVLEPRGIAVGRATDTHSFERVQQILNAIPIEQLKLSLDNAYVEFNSHAFASEIAYFPYNKSEAEWTACIYYTNICLPPPIHFNRRKSHIPSYEIVWLQDDEKACTPDHFYYVCNYNLQKDLEDLLSFRVGKTYDDRTIACPPYLVTEEKPDKQQEDEARHYIAFVRAAVLHEQLLLWHMTDEAQAQDNSAIPFHTFEIYGMTNYAKAVKIFRMFVRSFDETLESTGVRCDLEVVANLDLDREAHVQDHNHENSPPFNSDFFNQPEEVGALDNNTNEISANGEEIVSSEDTRISAENLAQSRPTKEKTTAHSVPKNLVLTIPAKNNPTKATVTAVSSITPLPTAVSKGRADLSRYPSR